MNELRQGFRSVQRNPMPLLLYLALGAATSLLVVGADALLGLDADTRNVPYTLQLLSLGARVVAAAVLAAGQAVIFARLGRELDRPLWKVADSRDALRRFFVPWYLLQLIVLAYIAVGSSLLGDQPGPETVLLFLSVLFVLWALMIPVGACVMFTGRFQWSELGQGLRPLVRRAPATGLLVFVGFLVYGVVFQASVGAGVSPWLSIVVELLGSYLDVVVFAAVWHLCIDDRDNAGAYDDLDF